LDDFRRNFSWNMS